MTRFDPPTARPRSMLAHRRTAAAATLVAALASLVGSHPAFSQGEAAEAARSAADGANLKRLPADRDGLTFRGESEARSFAVFMTRQEADKVGEFRLALVNAVSVLPDRSTLQVVVNGRLLATVPVRYPGRPGLLALRVPPGVLVPGFNAVSISATLAHRVDCSIKATYELWASLVPADTGFSLPIGALASSRTLADIGGEPLAADGTTHIHVRLPDHPGADAIERASRLVSRVVTEGHILRPLVDVGPSAGSGPGLDIAFKGGIGEGEYDGLRTLAHRADLSLLRDAASGRLTVLGADTEEAGEAVTEAAGDPSALAILHRRSGLRIDGAERISFGDLGVPDEAFSGRHYLKTIALQLPADFYPGSYDKVRVLLDGGYATDLDGQSSLVFRVNGALVSTLKLRGGSSGRFQHETVELPLQFFRPGANEVAIEGTLPNQADAACSPDTKPEAPRLTVDGSSEIVFPYLAHLGTLPQIAGALVAKPEGAQEARDAYLLHDGGDAIGSAMTIAANLAAEGAEAPTLKVHLAPPGPGDRPGIVLGSVGELPSTLSRAVERLTRGDASPKLDGTSSAGRLGVPNWRERVESFFRQHGFFFAAAPDKIRRLPLDERTLLVASVRREEANFEVAGVDLPRFTDDGRQWLVFTAKAPEVSAAGIERLVADGTWPRLRGEAVAMNVDDGSFAAIDASKPSYVVPRTIRVADLRPIAGGLMSSNVALTASALISLLVLLGLTTHNLLRTDRRRPK